MLCPKCKKEIEEKDSYYLYANINILIYFKEMAYD